MILSKTVAHCGGKFWIWLYDGWTHEKWIIGINILFEYFAHALAIRLGVYCMMNGHMKNE